jgi:Uma2 family endonuclease
MSATVVSGPSEGTLADLLEDLGDISPKRIRLRPPLGTATEDDVILAKQRFNRLCELIDGVLVEKAMGYYESRLAIILSYFLEEYSSRRDLGFVLGPDALLGIQAGQVRLPDVSFFLWSRFPGRILPPGAILRLAPDLAVEILSPSNTEKEMERKLREYFASGSVLVWLVNPEQQTVQVFTAADQFAVLDRSQSLDGGDLLPSFRLPLEQWFTRAGRRAVQDH